MLVVEVSKRYNMKEIVSHPWLRNAVHIARSMGDSSTKNEVHAEAISDAMLNLPGLSRQSIQKSLEVAAFDDVYAIYWLLQDEQPGGLPCLQIGPDILTQMFEKVGNPI